jgi:enoyl-CoA hydratase/carnithine racemase
MTDPVLVTREAGVMEIAFNRPEKKNALTRDMYAAVVGALQSADADPAIRVAILTGVGETFTSGNDIKDFQARAAGPNTSLGLVPEAGSSLLFPRMIGNQRASALLLLGEPLSVETALEWGFVYQVVDDAALMDTARALARRMAALPPQALRETKKLIRHGHPDVAARIAEELELFRARLASPEAEEAFTAFAEKRKPDFSRFG